MERRLVESHDTPSLDDGMPPNWHYLITHDGRHFSQHIFHYPEERAYRMRIYHGDAPLASME
ncbi:MAG: hypothetical protein U0531_16305 [Dehalococcoidia bacterium]